jgi:hypothetical protein
MLTLIGGIGIGTIIAAAISWRVAILNLRQASINALRDDLAAFLKELEVMHVAIGNLLACKNAEDLPKLEKQKQEARMAVLFVHRRILLRLNGTDPLHQELAQKLYEFDRVETRVPDTAAVRALMDVASKVLKHDWEDAAWWPLARPIMAVARLKGRYRRRSMKPYGGPPTTLGLPRRPVCD